MAAPSIITNSEAFSLQPHFKYLRRQECLRNLEEVLGLFCSLLEILLKMFLFRWMRNEEKVWTLLLIPTWGDTEPLQMSLQFVCANQRGISFHVPNLPAYTTGERKKLCWSTYYTRGFPIKGRLWPLLHQGLPLGGNAKQQQHTEYTVKPGSYCVLSNETKTAQQEMAPCKQGLERRSRLLSKLSSNLFW